MHRNVDSDRFGCTLLIKHQVDLDLVCRKSIIIVYHRPVGVAYTHPSL